MLNWLFGKKETTSRRARLTKVNKGDVPERGRAWKATEKDEFTQSHWGKATGASINTVLSLHLNDIIAKSVYESRVNPIVDGTINSHANDIIGPVCPKLEFRSDDANWNKQAETIWNEIATSIDGSGELSLVELLRQDIRSLWSVGGILSQYVYDTDATTIVKQRIHPLSCQDLYSGRRNTDDTMLGIKRNKLGRPVSYFVVESGVDISSYSFKINPVEIPARDIQHVYIKYEPRQWRGYPWLASPLQAIAELGSYDSAVLDAAKVAAMMSVLFYTDNPSLTPEENPANFALLRQSGVKVPTGWKPFELNGNQPTSAHQEFKADKLRDVGRPVGIPLMAVQRDASKHNYSSARFDGQWYARANKSIQGLLEQKRINPFVDLVITEAMLRKQLPYKSLDQWASTFPGRRTWIWTEPPHVDPVKEAMAQRIQLENKTLSPQRACLANNVNFETIVEEWGKANELFKKHGLPEMLGPIPADTAALAAYLAKDEKDDDAK